MLVTRAEIVSFTRAIEAEIATWIGRDREDYPEPGGNFLRDNPHLLLPLGFDEYRVLRRTERNIELVAAYVGVDAAAFPFDHEVLFRRGNSGEWQLFEGVHPGKLSKPDSSRRYEESILHFIGEGGADNEYAFQQLHTTLEQLANFPDDTVRTIVTPTLWLPRSQALEEIRLLKATRSIIEAVYKEDKPLRTLPWRTLEEIVAELLRAHGMEIYVTSKTRDGGRDIVARGELVPGEPMTLAIEVKQKPVVGIADVQRALRANEDFPGLLIATAGRFSSGVIAEKGRRRNALRLFLKDGVALKQWINLYLSRLRRESRST